MSQVGLFDRGKAAVISPCGLYRYRLSREVEFLPRRGMVNFVLLNPSTADHEQDDPTIRRLIGYAREWDFSDLVVTNIFAFRSTDPRALRTATDPIGPENDRHLIEQAKAAALVVCGWGAHGRLNGRGAAVEKLLREAGVELSCLVVTKDGQPGHPLYLSKDLQPKWLMACT